MKENIRGTRYTCDLCGYKEDVPEGSSQLQSPLYRVTLPTELCDEHGYKQLKLSIDSFDLCERCFNVLSGHLHLFYETKTFLCGGSSIKRKPEKEEIDEY